MSEKKNFKYCIVPKCQSNSVDSPGKIFLNIPKDPIIRPQWLEAMNWCHYKTKPLSDKTHRYCCEDHFNLQDDIINYTQFKLMGNVKALLRKGAVPSKFNCQNNLRNNFKYVFIKLFPNKNHAKVDRNVLLAESSQICTEFAPLKSVVNMPQKITHKDKTCIRPEFVNVDRLSSPGVTAKDIAEAADTNGQGIENIIHLSNDESLLEDCNIDKEMVNDDEEADKAEIDNTYNCKICGKAFIEDIFLKKHVLVQHMGCLDVENEILLS